MRPQRNATLKVWRTSPTVAYLFSGHVLPIVILLCLQALSVLPQKVTSVLFLHLFVLSSTVSIYSSAALSVLSRASEALHRASPAAHHTDHCKGSVHWVNFTKPVKNISPGDISPQTQTKEIRNQISLSGNEAFLNVKLFSFKLSTHPITVKYLHCTSC